MIKTILIVGTLLFLLYAVVTTVYVFEAPGGSAFGAGCTDAPERDYTYRNSITGKIVTLQGYGCRIEPRGFFWQPLD